MKIYKVLIVLNSCKYLHYIKLIILECIYKYKNHQYDYLFPFIFLKNKKTLCFYMIVKDINLNILNKQLSNLNYCSYIEISKI